jgi:hypothetical protein
MSSRRSCPKPKWKRRRRTERTTGGRDEQAPAGDGTCGLLRPLRGAATGRPAGRRVLGDPRRPVPGWVAGRLDIAGRPVPGDLDLDVAPRVEQPGGGRAVAGGRLGGRRHAPPPLEPVRRGRFGAGRREASARDMHPGDRADRPALHPRAPAGCFLLDPTTTAHPADAPCHAGPRWAPVAACLGSSHAVGRRTVGRFFRR